MQSWRTSSTGVVLRTSFARLLLVVVLAAPLGACESLGSLGSFFGKEDAIVPDQPPEKLYNEGVFLLDKRRDFKAAAKKFEEVERQHPYSEWARKALIMVAYARYEAKDYDESVLAARRFVTLHPGSSDAPYAQFLIGSS
jgi:outer membrane protein assembly factor BamD